MANGRNTRSRVDSSRVAGGFVALPWDVLDSPAYAGLSHPARSLLMELARQYVRHNNGSLLASRAYLASRGWKSADVIQRAKDELLAAGFIHETVKGHRPNTASRYAVTWYTLDSLPGYDVGAVESFRRGAYRENAILSPSGGTGSATIVPSHGTGRLAAVPSHGTIRTRKHPRSVPSHGHHLDKPSAALETDQRGRGTKQAGGPRAPVHRRQKKNHHEPG